MRLPQGVEWALHCTWVLTLARDGDALPARRLAELYGLPEAYLAKLLKALVRAGLLRASTGPRGGFRLARPPEEITVAEVADAVEGPGPLFHCMEIHTLSLMDDLFDALGLPTAPVVGNSLGGMFALWYAAARPGRIASLVAIGSPAVALPGATVRMPLSLMTVPVLGEAMLRTPEGCFTRSRAAMAPGWRIPLAAPSS